MSIVYCTCTLHTVHIIIYCTCEKTEIILMQDIEIFIFLNDFSFVNECLQCFMYLTNSHDKN